MKMDIPRQSIAMRGIRMRQGMNQRQLAKRLHIPMSTVQKMETGKKFITSEDAKKLADILETRIEMFD